MGSANRPCVNAKLARQFPRCHRSVHSHDLFNLHFVRAIDVHELLNGHLGFNWAVNIDNLLDWPIHDLLNHMYRHHLALRGGDQRNRLQRVRKCSRLLIGAPVLAPPFSAARRVLVVGWGLRPLIRRIERALHVTRGARRPATAAAVRGRHPCCNVPGNLALLCPASGVFSPLLLSFHFLLAGCERAFLFLFFICSCSG